MKTRKPPVCQACHQREALWARQYISDDTPTYSRLGYHYRGFVMIKLCDECKQQEQHDAHTASQ